MEKNITALREKVATLAAQNRAQIEEKGSAAWSPEEQSSFDNKLDELTRVQNQIKSMEKMRELEADDFFNSAAGNSNKSAGDGTISMRDAVGIFMRQGFGVQGDKLIAVQNAMSTTTAAEGGFTVPSEVANIVIEAMKAYGGMRSVSNILSTASGAALNFPTSDGTAEEGEIVDQNAPTNPQDITFGTVAVNPFMYSSKSIAVPFELVQDSAIDIVQFVLNRLGHRLAIVTNRHYTVGTGTNQPRGIVTAAAVGKSGAAGTAISISYDDLIDLIHSVNSAYRGNATLMLNDMSVAVLRKLKDTTGRPIWTPGSAEGVEGGIPSTICGYRYTINDHMPVMAANAKSVLFGDFSAYTIRDVANSSAIKRFDDSAYASRRQIGFMGWTRTGGNLLDPLAVRAYQNGST